MPIYAYRCSACGHAKDVLQKMSDPLLHTCPACGAETFTKQLTAAGFQLKGTGWYATDFKGGPAPAANAAAGEGGEGGEGGDKAKPADAAAAPAAGTAGPAAPAAAPSASPSPASDSGRSGVVGLRRGGVTAAEVGHVPARALELKAGGGELLGERLGAADRAGVQQRVGHLLQHVFRVPARGAAIGVDRHEIGRASCRERV